MHSVNISVKLSCTHLTAGNHLPSVDCDYCLPHVINAATLSWKIQCTLFYTTALIQINYSKTGRPVITDITDYVVNNLQQSRY